MDRIRWSDVNGKKETVERGRWRPKDPFEIMYIVSSFQVPSNCGIVGRISISEILCTLDNYPLTSTLLVIVVEGGWLS